MMILIMVVVALIVPSWRMLAVATGLYTLLVVGVNMVMRPDLPLVEAIIAAVVQFAVALAIGAVAFAIRQQMSGKRRASKMGVTETGMRRRF